MRISIAVAILVRAVFAQTVCVENGNVRYGARDRCEISITTQKLDTAARLSPDGSTIAFVRRTPGKPIEVGAFQADHNEIWIVPAAGGSPRRVLEGRAAKSGEPALAGFRDLQF